MRQRATVLELNGKNAVISVRRSSMCEGCEKKGGCGSSCTAGELLGANKTMTVFASNEIGAEKGDIVEIESESRTVLGYAALIFLFPLVVCALAYSVGSMLGAGEMASMLGAGVGFAAAFLLIIAFDRLKKKKGKPDIRIVKILRDGESASV